MPKRASVLRTAGSDRKSTRLNSSHLGTSYAVFCLKKKTTASSGLINSVWPTHRGVAKRSVHCDDTVEARRSLRVAGILAHSEVAGVFFFFFNDTATTEIYTLSLHDALPIYRPSLNAVRGPPGLPYRDPT